MGRPDLKPCPRQCTVWPNAIKLTACAEQLLPCGKTAVCCILPCGIVRTYLYTSKITNNTHWFRSIWVTDSPVTASHIFTSLPKHVLAITFPSVATHSIKWVCPSMATGSASLTIYTKSTPNLVPFEQIFSQNAEAANPTCVRDSDDASAALDQLLRHSA